MSKIIFLDIDGVLITSRSAYLQTKGLIDTFDPCATAMIKELIQVSGAQLVVSSTWAHKGKHVVTDLFQKNGLDARYLHPDWDIPRRSVNRSENIRLWLDAHPDVTRYVAIDDDRLDLSIISNVVLCNTFNGFSIRNYLESCVCLESFPFPDDTVDQYRQEIERFKAHELMCTIHPTDSHYDEVVQLTQILYK